MFLCWSTFGFCFASVDHKGLEWHGDVKGD